MSVRCAILVLAFICTPIARAAEDHPLAISWKDDWLTIRGKSLGPSEIRVHYLEAYCRPGSTTRKWDQTVIKHKARLVKADDDRRHITLEDVLADGVVVRHQIDAGSDSISFTLAATNPTDKPSEAAWAQPCVRVGPFTGNFDRAGNDYLPKCFIFLEGKLAPLPTPHWSTKALYTPGQVWCPKDVSRDDVNPRPLSPDVPSNGLIGCYSADRKAIFATAWQPYQELFQGVASCLHSDFRIGGLKPGEEKHIRGKIYILPADIPALLARYHADFPEHKELTSPPRF
jgi:hypothetical protein